MADDSEERGQQPAPSPAEKSIAAVGVVLTLALLAYLLYQAVRGDSSPPDVSIEVIAISSQSESYLVRFQAENHGDRTAAGLEISGRLLSEGELVEESQVVLDYLPARSQREGGLFFRNDPANLELDIRASGYADP